MDKLLADIGALIARGITPNLAAKIINDVRSGKAQKSKNHHMISFIIFTMILSVFIFDMILLFYMLLNLS